MPETAREIDLGVSTADAEFPAVTFEKGSLLVQYTDWQESRVRISFDDVVAFEWIEAESLIEGERFDSPAEMLKSAWVAELAGKSADLEEVPLRHVNLNFNENGKLSVLFSGRIHTSRRNQQD